MELVQIADWTGHASPHRGQAGTCRFLQRGATGPDNALLVEVQPLTPPKSRSGKLATIFKLAHYWRSGRLG